MILFTGGTDWELTAGDPTEAEVMRDAYYNMSLRSGSIHPHCYDQILLEEHSTSTCLNAVNSIDLLTHHDNGTWLINTTTYHIITSPFHQYRAYRTFVKQLQHHHGVDATHRVHMVQPSAPADDHATQLDFIREVLAIALYTVQGKI